MCRCPLNPVLRPRGGRERHSVQPRDRDGEPAGSSSLPINPSRRSRTGREVRQPPFSQANGFRSMGRTWRATTTTWTGVFTTSLGGTSVDDRWHACISFLCEFHTDQSPVSERRATGSVSVVVTTANGVATSSVSLAQFAPSFFLLDGKHVAGIILRTDGSGAYGGGSYDIIGQRDHHLDTQRLRPKRAMLSSFSGRGSDPPILLCRRGSHFPVLRRPPTRCDCSSTTASVIPSFAGLSGAGLYQIKPDCAAGSWHG